MDCDSLKMLELFTIEREIKVYGERENFLKTRTPILNMSSDQIAADLQAVISEVCRRTDEFGILGDSASLWSSGSPVLLLKIETLFSKEGESKESNKVTV